jgi:cytosine/adenosine deaminase-related metal-dependent hydrolase
VRTVIENAAIATVDGAGTEHANGHLVIEDGKIAAVGPGAAPEGPADRRIDATGCLLTPGFVNTHHHLYQWATRGYAPESDLFGWLTTLYPIWARLTDAEFYVAASAGLAKLALSGCTLAADHCYLHPRDGGDVFGAVVRGAERVGIRLLGVRGSMDRGESQGGLPPDSVVESTDGALLATEEAIKRFHDPSPEAMIQVAVGPCSPFTVSKELMREGAALARRTGTRLHTHLAETVDEEEQCLAEFGAKPVDYADELGWLADDVWLAHGIHFDDAAIARLGATRTGVAHCPSSNARIAAGMAPVRALLDAGSPVGLGVDGAASHEAGGLAGELQEALYVARWRDGATALTPRQVLWMATMGGARCLGRENELGSLEVGKLADLSVWRLSGLDHAGIVDPVAALVFSDVPPLDYLFVGGEVVVESDELRTTSESDIASELAVVGRRMAS